MPCGIRYAGGGGDVSGGNATPDAGAGLPRFSPAPALIVDAHNGPEEWTGARWNAVMAQAERNQWIVTIRLLEIRSQGSETP